MQSYLKATAFFDFDKPVVKAFADKVLTGDETSQKAIAVKLYYAVRDSFAYNPYVFSFKPQTLSASYCVQNLQSYCIPKAVLLGALARYKKIPSRLGLSDVKNHLSSPKLIALLKTDVFVMHGYIELYIDEQWVKATPAFDLALCKKLGVTPLDFDGETDSIFQEFSLDGSRHMQYLKQHGTFDDVPVKKINQAVIKAYPHLLNKDGKSIFNKVSHSLIDDLSD